ncbi:MAG: type 4a pilus biogenesis protein PilO [Candidatus Omnitrophota bacterium]|nr:type 4a pilus biogenesis protein PilO [Candidatus Omnitrophota bacterium]
MVAIDFFSKNKNKIINAGVILLLIFVAFYIYNIQSKQLALLEKSKNEEIKKSEVIKSLIQVEKGINNYKQIFNRKDLGSVIDAMTDIAKDTRVKVSSVKPGVEQQYAEYIKTPFLIVVRVADYHALGQFISKVENYKDLFLVEDINITTSNSMQSDKEKGKDLDISLKISTITCR